MLTTLLVTIAGCVFYLFATTANALAISPSDFPACSNPQGTLKVSYDSGVHGIIGKTEEYRGSDKVYTIDSNKLVQCFCPTETGNGVQTNWLKADGFTEVQINLLVRDGWTYVATGKVWGLEDVAYLTFNQDYTCRGSSNGSSSSGTGGPSGSSNAVLSASSAIVGLATTGNTITLLGLVLTSLVAFILGFFLRKSQ